MSWVIVIFVYFADPTLAPLVQTYPASDEAQCWQRIAASGPKLRENLHALGGVRDVRMGCAMQRSA